MRGFLLAAGYVVVAVVFASGFAWALSGVFDLPFAKVFSRSLLLMMAIGLIPLVRSLQFDALSLGLKPVSRQAILKCWLISLVSTLPLIAVFMGVGFRVIDLRIDYTSFDFVGLVAGAVLSGLLVAVFEETLFRGLLFESLKRWKNGFIAYFLSSFLYALVHFLDKSPELVGEPQWFSGMVLTLSSFTPLIDPIAYWDSFISLFLLGLLLCFVKERFGLWYCIGLHAGWVFTIKVFKEITVRDVLNPYRFLVGDYDRFIGLLASGWLLVGFVVLYLLLRRRTPG